MDTSRIPRQLHPLIPWVEKYGVGDDGFRDQLIYGSSVEELKALTRQLSDQDADTLTDWLADPELAAHPHEEYLKFSAFFMAYEYALALLESRQS